MASANDTDSKFDVEVEKNEHQRDQSVSWYDLKMNPNESTTLKLKLTNRDSTASTFDLVASQAVTGTGMTMTASDPIAKVQNAVIPSLRLGSQTLTMDAPSVTINPGETKEVTAHVQMPDRQLPGSWLGGFYVQKRVASRASNGYTNQFSYLAYVQLSNTDAVTKADLSLHKVSYTEQGQSGKVNIALQNDKQGYVANATSSVAVRQKGQSNNEVVYNQSKQSIANGSIFTYQVPTKKLSAGKTYVADITIHDVKNNLTWHWSKEFKTSALLPVTGWVNNSPLTRNYHWLWWLLLIPLWIWWFLIWRKNRKMVDIIEIVSGARYERRVSYKVYKQMLKDGIVVILKDK
nr:DUF916 domain-containing protein [Fructobacillus broussonetiae]